MVAEIRGMPSPQPSPTGEGADCSGFRRCRSSEKECPKHQQQEFFRQPLSQGGWNKRCKRFFRRPLKPSVGCVPQGTHAVGWGCRENGGRVRAYRTYPTYGLRLATMRATACLNRQHTPQVGFLNPTADRKGGMGWQRHDGVWIFPLRGNVGYKYPIYACLGCKPNTKQMI